MDSESHEVLAFYEDCTRAAAKYKVMINFHGANKPAREARTWPNEMTREGIREQEYVLWGTLPLAHYGALPFTRMAAGHGDFLPGYVQRRFLKNTTSMFQMASVISHTTPMLCWPDNPEAYLHSPLLEFVRAVPVTWDETRVLSGSKIGDTVIFARRKGLEWYVAALNCRKEPRDLELDLASLGVSGKLMTTYSDNAEGNGCRVESGLKSPPDAKLAVALRAGGGFMAHLAPPKEYPGWK
jgi:alpha-glucosidase